ncbi:MAG TPA: hypothetical protein VH255_05855 [Verrucomicrobiae bacterium]|nr:hypothetical protein [Verrucomicrobiae bacterium]
MLRFGQILMIIALLAMNGAHWLTLQTVAWTAMFTENLRTGSLEETMAKTFDGQHPCCLCKAIATGKKSEKKTDLSPTLKKIEFACERITVILTPPTRFDLLRFAGTQVSDLISEPAVPPPRPFLG